MQTNVIPVEELNPVNQAGAEQQLMKNAIWAGVGFIGASAVAAGFLLLARGGEQLSNTALSVILVGAGSYAASFAWQAASRALSRI